DDLSVEPRPLSRFMAGCFDGYRPEDRDVGAAGVGTSPRSQIRIEGRVGVPAASDRGGNPSAYGILLTGDRDNRHGRRGIRCGVIPAGLLRLLRPVSGRPKVLAVRRRGCPPVLRWPVAVGEVLLVVGFLVRPS